MTNNERELERLLEGGGGGYACRLARQLEDGAEPSFSPRFEASMAEMIRRESSRPAAPAGGVRRQLRAACLALVCLAGLGLGAMRVEAIRIPLLDFFVGQRDGYTQVDFPSLAGSASFHGDIQNYLPTWVPEGYRLEQVTEDGQFIHAAYGSDAGERILLSVTPNSGSSVMLDSEDSTVTQTEIGTRGAFVAQRSTDGRVVILMFDNAYAYTLTCYLEPSAAAQVMESIPGGLG